jgi:NAD(P)-dependent dehydrogenase (short-subunit alcohol dehydrogenase family)
MRFKGKVAIVTGGSKGIGKVIAKQLAQEGASTVINGRDMDALEKATREIGQEGGRITAIQADVSNRGDVETMIDKIIEDHGRIDILRQDH